MLHLGFGRRAGARMRARAGGCSTPERHSVLRLFQRQLPSGRIVCQPKQEFKHRNVLIPARFNDA